MDGTLALPLDALRSIFRFIPRRPRLLTLARVCKRWRAATDGLETHASLPLQSGPRPQEIRSHIESLEVHGECSGTLAVPAHIKKLTLNEVILEGEAADRIGPLPPLDALHVKAVRPALPSIAVLLRACLAASLTSLHVLTLDVETSPVQIDIGPLVQYLANVHLPALASLKLVLHSPVEAVCSGPLFALLRSHSMQLTSLDLRISTHSLTPLEHVAQLHFPALRSLTLSARCAAPEHLAGLLRQAPQLASVKWRLSEICTLSEMPPALLAPTVSITTDSLMLQRMSLAAFVALTPRLRRLKVPQQSFASEAALDPSAAAYFPLLTSLDVCSTETAMPALTLMRNVKELKLTEPLTEPPPPLPNLRSLCVALSPSQARTHLIPTLRLLLPACRSLRSLTLALGTDDLLAERVLRGLILQASLRAPLTLILRLHTLRLSAGVAEWRRWCRETGWLRVRIE